MSILRSRYIGIAVLVGASLVACKKENKETVYVIDPITVSKEKGNKEKLLDDIEYVSILYADIYSKTITNSEVNTISNVTLSIGDKRAAFELLLENFLNKSGTDIPSDSEMRKDVTKFVQETYLKFYGRNPNEFEQFYLVDLINKKKDITPEVVYYSFGTSDEYRFY